MFKRLVVVFGIAIFVAAIYALSRYLGQIDVHAVVTELERFSTARFSVALALVVGYLIVNSWNEVILCRATSLQLGVARPMTIAAIANPIGHSVGFTALSGAALRLRLYSPMGVSPQAIAHIAATSVLPFLLGAPCMIGIGLAAHPTQAAMALRIPTWLALVGGAALLITLAIVIRLARSGRTLRIAKWQLSLPSTSFLTIELLLGAGEICLVASVLYVFLPTALAPSYFSFIGVYLIAVLLAQISNAPAGLGVLEAALITLLPMIPTQQLLAAIIGYRAAFELVPLVIALVLLALYELASKSGLLGRLWRGRHRGESRVQ